MKSVWSVCMIGLVLLTHVVGNAQNRAPINAVYSAVRVQTLLDSVRLNLEKEKDKKNKHWEEILSIMNRYQPMSPPLEQGSRKEDTLKFKNLWEIEKRFLNSLDINTIIGKIKKERNGGSAREYDLDSIEKIKITIDLVDSLLTCLENLKDSAAKTDGFFHLDCADLARLLENWSQVDADSLKRYLKACRHPDSLAPYTLPNNYSQDTTDKARTGCCMTVNQIQSAIDLLKKHNQGLYKKLKDAFDELRRKVEKDPKLSQSLLDAKIWPPGLGRLLEGDGSHLTISETRFAIEISELNQSIQQAYHGQSMAIPDQSEMIDAMAIFLVNRVKEEAVIWFFDELKNNASQLRDLPTLFPKSIRLLVSTEPFQSPDLGKAWQYAIAEDFVRLPENILKTRFGDTLTQRNGSQDEALSDVIELSIQISRALQNRYTLSETLDNLYLNWSHRPLGAATIQVGDYIRALYAIKQEFFLVVDSTRSWLSPSLLLEMEDQVFLMALNLADRKYGYPFSRLAGKAIGTDKETLLIDYKPQEIWEIKNWMAKLFLEIRKLDRIYEEMEGGRRLASTEVAGFNYNVWTYTARLLKSISEPLTSQRTQVDSVSTFMHTKAPLFLDIYREIDRRNYAGALDKSMDMLQSFAYEKDTLRYFLCKKENRVLTHLILNRIAKSSNPNDSIINMHLEYYKIDSARESNVKNYLDTWKGVKSDSAYWSLCKDCILLDRTTQTVSQLGSFLAQVSEAHTSKDLSKVVEKFAMPSTSYKVKKSQLWGIYLNAFVGPYVGMEFVAEEDQGVVYGLSAPIGITWSVSTRKHLAKVRVPNCKPHKSLDLVSRDGRVVYHSEGKLKYLGKTPWNITLGVVDLGAVVSYRFKDQSSAPHQFKFEQFFSPGIHIAKGINGTPLVASFSMVYTPLLRRVGDDPRQKSVVRAQVGLLFDIPLGKIYSYDVYRLIDKM